MKTIALFLIVFVLCGAFSTQKQKDAAPLDEVVNNWHLAAAKADFNEYFGLTTDDFIFLGTDPTERWTRKEFEAFCKPYFDKGKAWDFKPSERNWVFSANGKVAWFDEKLDTWMTDCRGSGIMVKEGKKWKLAYYNLTVLIENDKIEEFIKLRKG